MIIEDYMRGEILVSMRTCYDDGAGGWDGVFFAVVFLGGEEWKYWLWPEFNVGFLTEKNTVGL
ncbi:hypothetical protein HanRHA438_Chr06g0258821 [Helianthus annuus]|nr:hypothetical protein HanRHA438_Chr06g0258821 [Helianthus annuus]